MGWGSTPNLRRQSRPRKDDMASNLPWFQRTRHTGFLVASFFFSGSSILACSVLLDHNKDQCTGDAECAAFPGGPGKCVDGACVAGSSDSHDAGSDGDASDGGPLGPPGCFPGTPTTQEEYANACTTTACIAFDNCARLKLCDGGTDAGDTMPPPPPPDGGASTSDAGAPAPPSVNCHDPVLRPNVVYITGSTNLPPLLKFVAPLLAQNTPAYTIVFFPSNSCTGADSVFHADPAKHIIKDKAPNYASYYDATGNAVPCLLDPGGNTVDVGESDVFASTCNTTYVLPSSSIAQYLGPIQPMTFVVNANSSQTAISAEAAHMIFGLGGNNGIVTPWTDPNLYYIRSKSTGTNQLLSRAVGVPPDQWWGVDKLTATNVKNALIGVDPAAADSAIGVLSADSADSAGANLRELYFQGAGQVCGFLPDSTQFTKDKINVRDGHYQIWGPMHFFAVVDASHQPSPAADAFVTRFSVPNIEQSLLQAITTSGLIPACAMKVNRTSEMGPLTPFSPSGQCGCYYDSLTKGSSSCPKCTTAVDCPASRPACNNGFCELK
jgi:ABC-type phosphate transport system substrate-binding protein